MAAPASPPAYLKFLHTYEKNLTRLYDEGRYIAFEESYQWIERRVRELNHSASPFKVVVNQFADWSQHEVSQLFPVFNYTADRKRSSAVPEGWDVLGSVGLGPDLSSFSNSLNWATDNNPQGMSVVAGPRNQGMCGACWAFVAAGSAEGAVGISTGHSVTLSVQELIDCSTEFNRGCNGGNPMFAYDYIREYGLSLWKEYPYADLQNPSCQSTTGYTKATINSDLQVPPDDEVSLKWYVSRGPVAIGVCGTDLDFMYYGGGIFDSPHCCSAQNHAMLIVGYGVDADSNTPFWVVQNSWGNIWGEDGYMRIKRSTIRGGGGGVCGLATFPTMAVGGHLITGNSTRHTGSTSTISEWFLDHNEQIISVFAAACFLLSIALLILSYWFSCRRRESERSAREAAVSRIKMDAVRSRAGSSDGASAGRRTPVRERPDAFSGSDISLLRQKLADLAPGQHYHNSDGVEYCDYDEDPTELSGLLDGKRLLCKKNLTPFSSVPNSRVSSVVSSPTSSNRHLQHYGSTIIEETGFDLER